MRRSASALLIVLLAAGGSAAWAYTRVDAAGPLPATAAIMVPHGGLSQLTDGLVQQGVVARPLLFRLAALATFADGPLHAGELVFPAQASIRQALAILRTAKPVQHRLTIPEGWTARQVASLLDRDQAATGSAAPPAEGTILPETYIFERGTSREQLLDRGRVAMDRALDKAWAGRAPGSVLTSAHEALVLASIVERETAKPDERPLIAGVFLNRLRLGQRLQSDPTVVYGASGGAGVLDHGITHAELDADTPYNTYRIAGLPPGPICMPGAAALTAVTHPAATDALYFVADGTGGHAFSRTQEEHLHRVAQWRAIEHARAAAPGSTPGSAPGSTPGSAPGSAHVPAPLSRPVTPAAANATPPP